MGIGRRDFTYIDDVVEGVERVMSGVPEKVGTRLRTSLSNL